MGSLRQLRNRHPECYFEAHFRYLGECLHCKYGSRCFRIMKEKSWEAAKKEAEERKFVKRLEEKEAKEKAELRK